ncbi:MAG TPA: lamin tail domain-containing protein, partial [bacterium]|nr:lamin tail domain-containing protein [bacterium]
ATARAQDVYLSEIRADANEAWIEVHNRGTTAADLSTWSLHMATHTALLAQNYWWPFPAGTTLAPNEYLRVHWYQDPPGTFAPGEYWTGTNTASFLFWLGAEPLSGNEGAIALFSTQQNSLMNSSSSVVDWVSWGSGGYQRESLAFAAGLWEPGRVAPPIPTGSSLARDPGAIGYAAYPDQTWFLDNTPTPLAPNITGAVLQQYGTACAPPGNHLLGAPVLQASSLPLIGNAQFALSVTNTTGIFGEYALVAFSAAAATAGQPSVLPPFAGANCHEAIDIGQIITTWLLPATILATDVPLPLNGLPPQVVGVELHAQALVVELLPATFPPYQGLSNALRVVVGQ